MRLTPSLFFFLFRRSRRMLQCALPPSLLRCDRTSRSRALLTRALMLLRPPSWRASSLGMDYTQIHSLSLARRALSLALALTQRAHKRDGVCVWTRPSARTCARTHKSPPFPAHSLTHTFTHIHMHTHTHAHTRTHTHYMYIDIHIYTTYVYIYVYIYILYICLYVYVYVYVYVFMYMYMYTYIGRILTR
jgi:hypothetical protein